MIEINESDEVPDNARLIQQVGVVIQIYFDDDEIIKEDARIAALMKKMRLRDLFKKERDTLIKYIAVTTSTGNIFNADETSQQRLARAIIALDPGEKIQWTLADNTIADITREELREALKLSVWKQTELWNLDK